MPTQPRALKTREKSSRQASRILAPQGVIKMPLYTIREVPETPPSVFEGASFNPFRDSEEMGFAVAGWPTGIDAGNCSRR